MKKIYTIIFAIMLLTGWVGCQNIDTEKSVTQTELIAMQNDYRVASYADVSECFLWLQDKDGNTRVVSLKKEVVTSVEQSHGQLIITFRDGTRATFYFVAYIDVTLSTNELSMAKCDSAAVTFTIRTEEPEKLKIDVLNANNVNAAIQLSEGKTEGAVCFTLKGLESFKEDVVVRFDNGQYKVEETISISRLNFGWDDGKDNKEYVAVGDGEILECKLLGGIDYETEVDCDWIEIMEVSQSRLKIRFLENNGEKRESTVILTSENKDFITLSVVQTMSQRAILMKLYEATNGDNWKDNSNWGSDAPLEDWFGVGVSNKGRVVMISLEGNHLDGYLPDDIYDLPFLRTLILGSPKHSNTLNDWDKDNWNIISGELSPKIGQLTNLTVFDIRGLVDITCGDIPDELWMPQLEKIDMNKVSINGRISSSIGNAINLKYLDISNNHGKTNLQGILPPEIAKLKNLEYLSLSGNRNLAGTLPENIGDMESLHCIDMEICGLTGIIPESIFRLKNLAVFNVYSNFLEGEFDLSRLTELPILNSFSINKNNHLNGIGLVPDFIRSLDFDKDGISYHYEYGNLLWSYEAYYNAPL